ncbi:hypothetical protein WJX79_004563 [Trebouxia sp. C0005]
MITVTIQTVSGKRYSLQCTDQQQVHDLKQQIANTTGVPADKLRLVHKGKAIHNDHAVSLSDQDTILAMRTRPPAAMHAAYEEELDLEEPEDARVRLPANASGLEKKLLAKLRNEHQLPERQHGEASAYSVFNNFQELPGQLNAHRLDDQLRRGQM